MILHRTNRTLSRETSSTFRGFGSLRFAYMIIPLTLAQIPLFGTSPREGDFGLTIYSKCNVTLSVDSKHVCGPCVCWQILMWYPHMERDSFISTNLHPLHSFIATNDRHYYNSEGRPQWGIPLVNGSQQRILIGWWGIDRGRVIVQASPVNISMAELNFGWSWAFSYKIHDINFRIWLLPFVTAQINDGIQLYSKSIINVFLKFEGNLGRDWAESNDGECNRILALGSPVYIPPILAHNQWNSPPDRPASSGLKNK